MYIDELDYTDFLADAYIDSRLDATPCNAGRGWVGTTKASGGGGCKRKKGTAARVRRVKEKRKKKATAASASSGKKKSRTQELRERQAKNIEKSAFGFNPSLVGEGRQKAVKRNLVAKQRVRQANREADDQGGGYSSGRAVYGSRAAQKAVDRRARKQGKDINPSARIKDGKNTYSASLEGSSKKGGKYKPRKKQNPTAPTAEDREFNEVFSALSGVGEPRESNLSGRDQEVTDLLNALTGGRSKKKKRGKKNKGGEKKSRRPRTRKN